MLKIHSKMSKKTTSSKNNCTNSNVQEHYLPQNNKMFNGFR